MERALAVSIRGIDREYRELTVVVDDSVTASGKFMGDRECAV